MLFIALLATEYSARAQFTVTTLSQTKGGNWPSFRFPLVHSKNKAVAQHINEQLQDEVLYNETVITDSTTVFNSSRYYNEDSLSQSGYSAIDYSVTVNNSRLLSIRFDMESTGAYSTNYPLYYNFDGRTGQQITAKELFTGTALQHLRKKLLKERQQRVTRHVKELITDGIPLEDSAYIRERFTECLTNAEEEVNKIFIKPRSIVFYKEFCFPHAALPFEADLDVELTIRELASYLTPYGRTLLGLTRKP